MAYRIQHPLLTESEERTLLAALPAEWARDALLAGNQRLVAHFANRWSRTQQDFDDLMQEGNQGLLTAIEKWDAARYPDNRFSTYAGWWVRQAVARAARTQQPAIRVPDVRAVQVAVLRRAEARLMQRGDYTDADLERETGFSTRVLDNVRRVPRVPVSLDDPIGDRGQGLRGELIPDPDWVSAEERIESDSLARAVRRAMAGLDPRDRQAVEFTFGFDGQGGRTRKELGQAMGVTPQRASQVLLRALATLEEHLAPLVAEA